LNSTLNSTTVASGGGTFQWLGCTPGFKISIVQRLFDDLSFLRLATRLQQTKAEFRYLPSRYFVQLPLVF